ncbi:MAG: hypothetical protein M3O30_06065 [Planctomycetota bacterium]|nr:hypothetical protein [Planctomycetota bacterium]
MFLGKSRAMGLLVVAFLLACPFPGRAGLTANPDAKAVQWSTLIVNAKLISIADPVPLGDSASTQPASGITEYRLYAFEVTDVLDGAAKTGDRISVVRFVKGPDDSTECNQSLAGDQVGKQFILLLRPEADLSWSRSGSDADPRTSQLHDLKAMAIVYLVTPDDLGGDGLSYLKTTISDTRDAESKFSTENARAQAQTLANAADDTEAEQAEHTLVEMGPKANSVLAEVAAKANDVGKARLHRVLDDVMPPPLSGPASSSK